ncbi:hypothetical protein X975_22339, partial [Stegodyphus mimosarum]
MTGKITIMINFWRLEDQYNSLELSVMEFMIHLSCISL